MREDGCLVVPKSIRAGRSKLDGLLLASCGAISRLHSGEEGIACSSCSVLVCSIPMECTRTTERIVPVYVACTPANYA